MPTQFLSTAERRRLMSWPATVAEAELATYYTLDAVDLDHIGQRRSDGNRLGVALQLVPSGTSASSPMISSTHHRSS